MTMAPPRHTVLRARETEVAIGPDLPFVIIGERINPTNRSKLTEAMDAHDMSVVQSDALAQVEAGAQVLDINVGTAFGLEWEIMPLAVRAVLDVVDVPLSIDSPNPKALAAGVEAYYDVCGPDSKPLVNSTNAETDRLEAVIPLVAQYGAAVIGLTNDDEGISQSPEKRFEVAQSIKEAASAAGIPDEDLLIDAMTLTVGADHTAASCTMEVTERVSRELGLNTTSGASNVSFGLPGRPELNTIFLAMMMTSGLTSAITNPLHPEIVSTIVGADLMRGRDPHAKSWVGLHRERNG
jgi:5-methyltetrahydrofolate--homocysteine methyltransferase